MENMQKRRPSSRWKQIISGVALLGALASKNQPALADKLPTGEVVDLKLSAAEALHRQESITCYKAATEDIGKRTLCSTYADHEAYQVGGKIDQVIFFSASDLSTFNGCRFSKDLNLMQCDSVRSSLTVQHRQRFERRDPKTRGFATGWKYVTTQFECPTGQRLEVSAPDLSVKPEILTTMTFSKDPEPSATTQQITGVFVPVKGGKTLTIACEPIPPIPPAPTSSPNQKKSQGPNSTAK